MLLLMVGLLDGLLVEACVVLHAATSFKSCLAASAQDCFWLADWLAGNVLEPIGQPLSLISLADA